MSSCPKPCAQCPYVLNRTQGFTGPYAAGELHTMAASEMVFPCHMTMKPGNTGQRCRGIDLYRDQLCKSPRNPVELLAQRETVREHGATEKAVASFQLAEYHSKVRPKLKSISKRRKA